LFDRLQKTLGLTKNDVSPYLLSEKANLTFDRRTKKALHCGNSGANFDPSAREKTPRATMLSASKRGERLL